MPTMTNTSRKRYSFHTFYLMHLQGLIYFHLFLQIQKSVSARMEYTTVLEQDTMEGVDADEWNE